MHYFRAAQGWLELGCFEEANEELENISPQNRTHPEILEIRWQIYAHAKKWDACSDIALAIMKADPKRFFGWIHRSFALHALRRTEEAYNNLACVAHKFPEIWTVPYNLSCYCAQLGRFEESEAWFKKAILVNVKAVECAGIDDPDLYSILSRTPWPGASAYRELGKVAILPVAGDMYWIL